MNRASTKSLVALCLAALAIQADPRTALANGAQPEPRVFPDITLPEVTSGEAAIHALGDLLPAVAQAHRMAPEEFQRVLREDHSAKLDRHGRMFYTDLAAPDAQPATTSGSTSAAAVVAPLPLDQTFLLHSRPGAAKLIYLDFDGHVLSGTAWNSYNGGRDIICPAWNTDGNASVFGDSERTAIQGIWQRVAEDYSAFNVDVTTEYPGEAALTRSSASDTSYGIRILVSPISSYFGNYGGFTYVGCFDDVGDYYKTALVFPERLANAEKYIGEACAHECGHSLGLSHDGTTAGTEYYAGQGSGETGWAPIMGNGYYKNLTQWSKGEYSNANNKQDDLAIISSYVGWGTDDYGNTLSTATTLPAGAQLSVGGFIDRPGDIDVFRFVTDTGNISFSVSTAYGPDLDTVLTLYNSSGEPVASANPADLLSGSLSAYVVGGTYYIAVAATGKGDPLSTGYSAYAALGEYLLSGAVVDPTGHIPPSAVAQASPASGTAPLAVQFDSSLSSDPDGSIVAWFWDFGDGTSIQGASPSHLYSVPGSYVVTLTVTDNSGLTGSTTLQCTALGPNQAPTAVVRASPATGYAPLSTTLDGTGSTDADGRVVSYDWSFGDGTSGSGPTVQHVYANAGAFTVTLTVTDDRGASSRATSSVVVQNDPTKVLYVSSITLSASSSKAGTAFTATVAVRDGNNNPVPSASVTGQWTGSLSGTATGSSGSNGDAVFTSKRIKNPGTVTFTVKSMTKSGYTYDSTRNLVSTATLSQQP